MYHDFITGWLKMSSSSFFTHSQEREKWNNCSSSGTVGVSQTQCNAMESKHKAMLPGSICVKETRPGIWRVQMIDIHMINFLPDTPAHNLPFPSHSLPSDWVGGGQLWEGRGWEMELLKIGEIRLWNMTQPLTGSWIVKESCPTPLRLTFPNLSPCRVSGALRHR